MAITVKIVRVPGAVTELMLDDGATVSAALAAAGESVSTGEALKVNGSSASGDTRLNDGDRLVISKEAKGNKD